MCKTINECLNKICNEQIKAQEAIYEKLKKGCENRFTITNIQLTRGKDKKNDYRNYVWIEVVSNTKRKYWITLFYNDYDQKTLNVHTQFGKIQFWYDIYQTHSGVNGVISNLKYPCGNVKMSTVLVEMKYPKLRDSNKFSVKDISKNREVQNRLRKYIKQGFKVYNPEQSLVKGEFKIEDLINDFIVFIETCEEMN